MRARESIPRQPRLCFMLLAGLVVFAGACGAPFETYEYQERRFSVTAASGSGRLVVAVEPRASWKLAVEFPSQLRLRMEGSGENRRGAEEAAERSEKRLRYVVPVPVEARAVDGVVVFGVCQGPICERVAHTFTVPSP